MLVVATLANPRAAQAFVDYMKTQGIELRIQAVSNHEVEILASDADYHRAVAEFQSFITNPNDDKYLAASWQSGGLDSGLQANHSGPSIWQKFIAGGGWVTLSTITVCVVIYLLGAISNLYDLLFFPPREAWADGELWRWLTPAFMHFSLLHIGFNLGWWWLLGGQIERRFSSNFLLIFLLFSAVGSNVSQYLLEGSRWFGGLSGVVFALFGYCWLYGKLRPQDGISFTNGMFAFSLVWLAIGFADMLPIAFANGAHLSGLLIGLLVALGHWQTRAN